MSTDEITGIVSARHTEYMPNLTDEQFTQIWPPPTQDDDEWWDWMDQNGGDNQALKAKWAEVTGIPEVPGDWDLSWEHIFQLRAPRAAVEAGLDSLIGEIDTVPGGDDDTFDYWPSGVILAQELAELLNDSARAERIREVAHRVILEDKADYAAELLDKVGYREEGDPGE